MAEFSETSLDTYANEPVGTWMAVGFRSHYPKSGHSKQDVGSTHFTTHCGSEVCLFSANVGEYEGSYMTFCGTETIGQWSSI